MTRDEVIEPFLQNLFENMSRDGTIQIIDWTREPLRPTLNNLSVSESKENIDEPKLSSPKTLSPIWKAAARENVVSSEAAAVPALPFATPKFSFGNDNGDILSGLFFALHCQERYFR